MCSQDTHHVLLFTSDAQRYLQLVQEIILIIFNVSILRMVNWGMRDTNDGDKHLFYVRTVFIFSSQTYD